MNKNYTLCLDTFLFRRSWGELFTSLPDEQAGQLIKAVYAYCNGTESQLEHPELQVWYNVITKQLNYSARKYAVKFGLSPDE